MTHVGRREWIGRARIDLDDEERPKTIDLRETSAGELPALHEVAAQLDPDGGVRLDREALALFLRGNLQTKMPGSPERELRRKAAEELGGLMFRLADRGANLFAKVSGSPRSVHVMACCILGPSHGLRAANQAARSRIYEPRGREEQDLLGRIILRGNRIRQGLPAPELLPEPRDPGP